MPEEKRTETVHRKNLSNLLRRLTCNRDDSAKVLNVEVRGRWAHVDYSVRVPERPEPPGPAWLLMLGGAGNTVLGCSDELKIRGFVDAGILNKMVKAVVDGAETRAVDRGNAGEYMVEATARGFSAWLKIADSKEPANV